MTKDITLQLEPFLTGQSKQFLEHKYESPVIMFSVGSQQQIRLCQYVGTIVNKKSNELTDADYKRFAEFINKAVENRVLQYGVYGFPMVMDLADGAIGAVEGPAGADSNCIPFDFEISSSSLSINLIC